MSGRQRNRSKSTSSWDDLLRYEGPVVNVFHRSQSLPIEKLLPYRNSNLSNKTPQIEVSGKMWELLSLKYASGVTKLIGNDYPDAFKIAVIINVRLAVTKSLVFQIMVWSENGKVDAKAVSGTTRPDLLKFNNAAREFLRDREAPDLPDGMSEFGQSSEDLYKSVLLSLGV